MYRLKHALILQLVLLILLFHAHVKNSQFPFDSLLHAGVHLQNPAEVLAGLCLIPHFLVGFSSQVKGLYYTWSANTEIWLVKYLDF